MAVCAFVIYDTIMSVKRYLFEGWAWPVRCSEVAASVLHSNLPVCSVKEKEPMQRNESNNQPSAEPRFPALCCNNCVMVLSTKMWQIRNMHKTECENKNTYN